MRQAEILKWEKLLMKLTGKLGWRHLEGCNRADRNIKMKMVEKIG